MPEGFIIRHCAPTLAGIKTGSLFSCPYDSKEALQSALGQLDQTLSPKGLRVMPLRFSEKRALVYLYRPKDLTADLAHSSAAAMLEQRGYTLDSCEGCISQLMCRLQRKEDFPHEIGLFLGYPPEDVQGFIDNKSRNYKCVDQWKVYGDEAAAQRRFAQFRQCTQVYCDQWAQGKSIERLTVADQS